MQLHQNKATSFKLISTDETKLELQLCKKVEQSEHQLLESILAHYKVKIPSGQADKKDEISHSIKMLDELIGLLSSVDQRAASVGTAPGFETKKSSYDDDGGWAMNNQRIFNNQYENFIKVSSNKLLAPFPSCANALGYFKAIRDCWLEREEWAATKSDESSDLFCSCIGAWEHHNSSPILMVLANQALEMLMTKEASESCSNIIKREAWNEMYTEKRCESVKSLKDKMYIPSTSIQFLDGRHEYVSAYAVATLAAKETIDVCLCYVFPQDPVQRYFLLDLLPWVARNHNVTIRLVIDLMTIESSIIKSVFVADENGCDENKSGTEEEEVMKFLQCLPTNSPEFSYYARRVPASTTSFLSNFLEIISSIPNDRFQLRWFCARDKNEKYRVKNHIKCHIFDGNSEKGTVITGGSNLSPMVDVTDSDLLVSGKVSQKYQSMYDDLWSMSSYSDAPSLVTTTSESSQASQGSDESSFGCMHSSKPGSPNVSIAQHTKQTDTINSAHHSTTSTAQQQWTDASCSVAFLNSIPSSLGEDCILRHVIGAIGDSKKSIILSMGHSNVPMPVARALAAATGRGVNVRLLFNSLYTCDLRGGQRDLFLSLGNLINVAPMVHIYVTNKPPHKDAFAPFLHAKYVVVDGEWSAAGSWNLWTRAAFYEMEAEIFVYSKAFAKSLETKFEREMRESSIMELKTISDALHFCPKGCKICKQFGPFYQED